MPEPRTLEHREAETDETLANSAAAKQEAASVIDDIVQRLNRLSAEMRRIAAADARKRHDWNTLLDGRDQ